MGLLGLCFWVGLSWGEIKRDVSTTKKGVERIEPVVGQHAASLQAINQTLHGPEGRNGLYGTVKKLDERFDEFERRLTNKSPHPSRRGSDKKRRTA